MNKIMTWLKGRAMSVLLTAATSTVILQLLVGTILDLLLGFIQIALVYGGFRVGSVWSDRARDKGE